MRLPFLLAALVAAPALSAQPDAAPAWEAYGLANESGVSAHHFNDTTYAYMNDFYFRPDGGEWDGPHFVFSCGGVPAGTACGAGRYAVGPGPDGRQALWAYRPWIHRRQEGQAPLPLGWDGLGFRVTTTSMNVLAPLRADLLVVGVEGMEEELPDVPGAEDFDVGVSRDGGLTWTGAPIAPPGTQSSGYGAAFVLLDTASAAPGRLVAGAQNGLAYSDDLGASWTLVDEWYVPFRYIGHVAAYDRFGGPAGSRAEPGTAYVGIRDYQTGGVRVVASRDGAAWEERAFFPIEEARRPQTLLALPDGRLVLGTGEIAGTFFTGRVLMSEDGGRTWAVFGTGYPTGDGARPESVALGTDGRLYVATQRRGVYRTAEPVTDLSVGAGEEPTTLPGETGLSAPYPNPATDGLTVPVEVAAGARAEVTLFDLLGRRIGPVHAGSLGPGRHALPVVLGALPAGLYLLRCEARAAGGALTVTSRRVTVAR